MKYCSKTTRSHPVSVSYTTCLEDINALIKTEGYLGTIPVFTNTEVVINLDKAEEIIAKATGRNKRKSMDMAFGLISSDSTINEILMVELRLNYDNPNNLNREELEGKVAGSTLVLSNTISIRDLFIFIFKTNLLEEAKNRLSRMIPKINSNYIVMDIHQLKAAYF